MYYTRKIKCPRHHMLRPGRLAWQIEDNPLTKDTKLSDADLQKFGIRKWRYKRDRFGNKIPDYRNHYQPEISAAYAVSNIYDPVNTACQRCKRCLEGVGAARILGKPSLDGRTISEVAGEMLKDMQKHA